MVVHTVNTINATDLYTYKWMKIDKVKGKEGDNSNKNFENLKTNRRLI